MAVKESLRKLFFPLLAVAFLYLCAGTVSASVPQKDTFPWMAEPTTALNVRSGPGTSYPVLGVLPQGTGIRVLSREDDSSWVVVDLGDEGTGYVNGYYLSFLNPYTLEEESPGTYSPLKALSWAGEALKTLWKILRVILVVALVLLVISYPEEIFLLIFYVGLFIVIGGALTKLFFGRWNPGAAMGFIVAVAVGLKYMTNDGGGILSTVMGTGYFLVSLPFLILNSLQMFLSRPWRNLFKRNWASDGVKKVLRPVCSVLTVLLQIAITPLRLINSIYYNLVVHFLTELYDLFWEVLSPSGYREGRGVFWRWLVFFPWRLLKYPVFHGLANLIESVIWTVFEIFLPSVTLFHGTDMKAGQSIVGSRTRNDRLRNELNWKSGTFLSSENGWGGIGVFFGSSRKTAYRYANDSYRLSRMQGVAGICDKLRHGSRLCVP